MGLLGGDSNSSTDALQQTLSTQGGTSPVFGAGKALKNSAVNFGTGSSTSIGNGATVTYTDGGAIAALKDIASQVISKGSDETQKLFDQMGAADQASNSVLASALASQSDLAKNAATGGQSEQNKVTITILVIAAALVGLIMYFRK